MAALPTVVREYLHAVLFSHRAVAYFLVNADGTVREWGGDLASYGIAEPRKGAAIGDVALPLAGMLPGYEGELHEPMLLLPAVELCPERYADIHLFPAETGYWVLMLDRSDEVAMRQRYQQKGNELSLLYERTARMLGQYIGEEIADDLAKGILTVKEGGERRVVTALFADIRGFTPFSEHTQVERVFQTLNAYLQAMIQPILEEKGLVDKIIGDAVMALFGVVPAGQSPAAHATAAAMRMMEVVGRMNDERKRAGEPALGIGIGMATGPAALGILGTKARRTFSAIGHFVNLAARLEGSAGPGEILIDENTFRDIGALGEPFRKKRAVLKGINGPITMYSHRMT